MRRAGSNGWHHRSAHSARVPSRSDLTSSCVRRRGSDRLWTRCRASALPPVADWGLTLVGAVQGSRGTSSAMPLEHLAGTDPRCNDRYHRCLGATLGAAPSRPAAAMPPRFPRCVVFDMNQLLFGKSRQFRGELTGRRVHLRSKKHRILQKAICNSFLQFLQIFPDEVKT